MVRLLSEYTRTPQQIVAELQRRHVSEPVSDHMLRILAAPKPEHQQGMISLADQATISMVLRDICLECLAHRAIAKMGPSA